MGNGTGKGPKEQNRLSAKRVEQLSEPGLHHDGGGLYLQVSKSGAKSWILRYQRDGKQHMYGLGPLRVVSLKQARERAQAARLQLLDGIDPIEARRSTRMQAKLEAAQSVTFREAAERFLSANEYSWKSSVHRQQWKQTLEQYAFPVFGDLPVAAIDTALVLQVLEPIWADKGVTAGRLRGRIERVLDWAKARGMREGENPARWRGHLAEILPKPARAQKHHTALPFAAVPAFVAELREQDGVAARALEFAILTAARTGEVLGALWSEIDLAQRTWTIPADKTKAKRQHKIPLSGRVVEILERLPREAGNPHVFPGVQPGKPLHRQSMLLLLQE